MKLLPFVSRRLFHAIFVLLGLSIVIFLIARVMPGDPARVAVGARADDWGVDNLRELAISYGFGTLHPDYSSQRSGR